MKTTLLITTLNEIDGVRIIMPQIDRDWVDQILFCDGGSTDGTIEYIKDNGYELVMQSHPGARYAYIDALPHCIGDVIIPFSPDGNSIPDVIPSLIHKIKYGYDMVIASRYMAGAMSFDDDTITGFGNWFLTTLINLIYGSRYTDAMVMYRAWRKQIFYDLQLDKDETYQPEEKLFGTIVGCDPMLSIRAAKKHLLCAEIPADEPKRIGGKRKLQIWKWGAAYLWEILKEIQ